MLNKASQSDTKPPLCAGFRAPLAALCALGLKESRR